VITPLPQTLSAWSDPGSSERERAIIPLEAEGDAFVAPTEHDSFEQLTRAVGECRRCALAEERTQTVFGIGNPAAGILFIGEAPGREEDLRGEPFVGKAGQLLDRMLAAIGLDRDSAYIMNMLKCRPPGNRDPQAAEVEACSEWFDRQWQLLDPKVVCLLGRIAAQSLLTTDAPLSSLRGRWHTLRGVPTMVTYHPAYLLRSPDQKGRAWHDLLQLRQRIKVS